MRGPLPCALRRPMFDLARLISALKSRTRMASGFDGSYSIKLVFLFLLNQLGSEVLTAARAGGGGIYIPCDRLV